MKALPASGSVRAVARGVSLPGAYTALPIFTDFLKSALGPRGRSGFEPPPGVEKKTVMARLGPDAGGCREVSDWFLPDTRPRSGCGFWERMPGVGAGPRVWPWTRSESQP